MNIQLYKRLAKVLGLSGLLILSNASVNAETIVHTTRYSYDTESSADTSPQVQETNYNAPAKAKSKSVKKNELKPHRPAPYTFESAIEYAKVYPEDITVHRYGGYKDKYGNFSKWRCLDFLGDAGLFNRGDSFWGRPSHTYLRLMVHYGQETNAPAPFATLIWAADINKRHQNDINTNINDKKREYINTDKNGRKTSNVLPKYIRIVFESGYEKELSTNMEEMRWLPYSNPNIYDILYFPLSLFFATSVGDKRSGYILLSSEDLWDIHKHGYIANVYLDDDKGYGVGTGSLSFFYSGEKQAEDKEQLTYGFEHIVRLLNINPATIAYERNKRKAAEKKAYKDKLRSEVKDEIYKEEIKKELGKEIMEEVREEYRLDKEIK